MFARSLIVSLITTALVGSALPAAALVSGDGDDVATAELVAKDSPRDERAKEGGKAKGKDKAKDKDPAKHFPMKAADFQKRIDKRLDKARTHLIQMMENRKVAEADQKKALARFDQGATRVRGAATEAGKDGTVTLDEAKRVREVAKEERKAMKGTVAGKKDKKGKSKKA